MLDVSTTKIELVARDPKFWLLFAAISVASSGACVGSAALDDPDDLDGGADILDGAAGDGDGGAVEIVGIIQPDAAGDGDGDAAGDGDGDAGGDGDGYGPPCNCTGQPEIRRDAQGRLLPYCTSDLAGLVEAAGYICDDAGACVPATTTRACGAECEPATIFVTRARCGS